VRQKPACALVYEESCPHSSADEPNRWVALYSIGYVLEEKSIYVKEG